MRFSKMILNINGADRTFICDKEKDTLAEVLRRLGLTGTKVGCGIGVCGACSVIIDGKVVRSCTRKIKSVDEYAKIITVEGLGSPMNPHPLQAAWVALGAVQCGFCVPGFEVSAYQLLQENPDPTREDIRDWFQKHRNVCRCTGYKQIVDAVMEAAAIMRGEKTIADIKYDWTGEKDLYGKPLERPNGLAKACGVADYGDDVALKMPDGTLHAAMAMPRVANHAKIINIDTSVAENMEGVYKIITAKDVIDAGCSNSLMPFTMAPRSFEFGACHNILQDEKIVNWGNVIAIAVADTKDHAIAAAEAVKMEYEQLPEYMTYQEAVMPDAMEIHEGIPNNYCNMPLRKGEADDVPELIGDAEYSVEGSFYSSREPHMSIEGDTVQSYYDEDDMLTIQCKSMTTYFNRDDIANVLGLDAEKVRVIENPTGGSFGWAMNSKTYAMCAMVTYLTDKPCALHIDYSQYMAISGKRAPSFFNASLGCDKDGRIVAGQFDGALDHGAYLELGDDEILRFLTFTFFPYVVPNALGLARVATTNHAHGVPYRGYGAPQAYTAGEALIDMMAEKIGMDQFDFRYKNIARKGDHNMNQVEFLQYPMEEIMDKMKPYYDAACKRRDEFNAKSDGKIKRGVGLAWGGYNVGAGVFDEASVAVELLPDGKFKKYDTWQDQGQGGDAGSLIVTLQALREYFPDVNPDDISLLQADTKYCPNTGESAGSRSHFANGKATIIAVKSLVDAMRKEDGSYRTYEEMTDAGIATKYDGDWSAAGEWDYFKDYDPNDGSGRPIYAFTYALFMSEVEVDTETGKTTVQSFVSVDEVGKVGNIQSVNGQVFGGISHSIGFALSENYEDVKKHNNMLAAGIPYIKDVPDDMTVIHLEGYDERGPFGSSGVAEAFQSSDHMAVINAINNATGVRIYELPASPEKVKEGLEQIAKGEEITPPEKYYMGTDFFEELEKIKENPITAE